MRQRSASSVGTAGCALGQEDGLDVLCCPFQLQHSLCVLKVQLLLQNLFWELWAALPLPFLSLQVSGKEGERSGRGQAVLGRVAPCWSAQQQPWNPFKGKAVPLHQGRNQHCGQRPSTASWETNKRELWEWRRMRGISRVWKRTITRLSRDNRWELSPWNCILLRSGLCAHCGGRVKRERAQSWGDGEHWAGRAGLWAPEGTFQLLSPELSYWFCIQLLHFGINTGMLSGQTFLDIFWAHLVKRTLNSSFLILLHAGVLWGIWSCPGCWMGQSSHWAQVGSGQGESKAVPTPCSSGYEELDIPLLIPWGWLQAAQLPCWGFCSTLRLKAVPTSTTPQVWGEGVTL